MRWCVTKLFAFLLAVDARGDELVVDVAILFSFLNNMLCSDGVRIEITPRKIRPFFLFSKGITAKYV